MRTERPSAFHHSSWEIFDFIFFLALQQIGGFFFYSFLSIFFRDYRTIESIGKGPALYLSTPWIPSEPHSQLFLSILSTLLADLLMLALILFRLKSLHSRGLLKNSEQKAESTTPNLKKIFAWIFLSLAAILLFNIFYKLLLRAITGQGIIKQKIALFFKLEQPLFPLLSGILLVSAIAPLAEELLYRGILFSALRRHLSPQIAAATSALIFAALHFEPITIPPLAVMGFFLAISFYKTETLWTPILIHVFNNIGALFIALLAKGL